MLVKMPEGFKKLLAGYDRIIFIISGSLFLAAVIAAFISMCDRSLHLRFGIVWGEEVSRMCMIASVFMIMGIALRRGGQIAFTIFLDKMSRRTYLVFALLIYFLITVIAVILAYYGLIMTLNNSSQMTPVLELSTMFLYGIIPIGGVLILFETLSGMYFLFKELVGRENANGGA